MSSWPNGCVPKPKFDPGLSERVGQPVVPPGQSSKRSAGISSVVHFHQPGIRIGPIFVSNAVMTKTMSEVRTTSAPTAAR